jgi:phosphotriesterase-related protein
VGCGRDAERLAALERASGVRIIASTGFHKTVFYPEDHWIFKIDSRELADIFASELEAGMFALCDSSPPAIRTPYRAGYVKTALDKDGLTGPYEPMFAAAVSAAKRTGRALMVHIEQGADPIALADYLAASGPGLPRVVFCHMDRAVPDLAVHREICSRGIYLEYDTIGRPKYHDDEREADIALEMLAAGFEDRLLMGLDTTRERLASYGGRPGLTHIIRSFIPLLRRRGVAEGPIRKIFLDNPANFFSHE